MLPQRSPKMLSELFEHIFGCPRIRGKSERKFEGHICNIKLEKVKLARLSLFFGFGVPLYSVFLRKRVKNAMGALKNHFFQKVRNILQISYDKSFERYL